MTVDFKAEQLDVAANYLLSDDELSDAKRTHLSEKVQQFIAVEFAFVAIAALAASFVYHISVLNSSADIELYLLSALTIAAVQTSVALGLHNYSQIETQPRHKLIWNSIATVLLTFSIFLSILFLFKLTEVYSRATFFLQVVTIGFLSISIRIIFHSKIQSAIAAGNIAARRVVLLGRARNAKMVIRRLRETGIQVVGSFGIPKEGSHEPIQACRELQPDDILILASSDDLLHIDRIVKELAVTPASVHLLLMMEGFLVDSPHAHGLGRLATVQLLGPKMSSTDRTIKRVFDVVLAATALILLSPLLLLVVLAIKLDSPGPALFRQVRHGYNNNQIRVLKFRSMTVVEEGDKFHQAVKNDPRVTQIGRILRRSNIDELPQLWNVLTGEMSIVGPRPHAIAHNKIFEAQIAPFSRRHNVKPGITGWAQVNGLRGETDTLEKMQLRVDHDLYYIDHWSFLFDLKIIVMTVFSRNAYVNAY